MSERKIITGNVEAKASEASIAMNAPPEGIPVEGAPQLPPTFYFREITHNRVRHFSVPEGFGRALQSLVERVPEGGEWPQDMARFQGIGRLDAETPQGMVRRDYRFDVPAVNLDEAWQNYDEATKRGAVQAERAFREEYSAMMRAQAQQIAVPTPGAARGILDANGRLLNGR